MKKTSGQKKDEDSGVFYRNDKESSEPLSNLFVSDIKDVPFGLELVSANRNGNKKDWFATFDTDQTRAEKVFLRDTFVNRGTKFRLIDIETDRATREPVACIQRVGKSERIRCRIGQPVFQPVKHVLIFNKSNGDTFGVLVGDTFEFDGKENKIVSIDDVQQEMVVKSDSGLFSSAQYRRISKDRNEKLKSFKEDKSLALKLVPFPETRPAIAAKPQQDAPAESAQGNRDVAESSQGNKDVAEFSQGNNRDVAESSQGNKDVAEFSQGNGDDASAALSSGKEPDNPTKPVASFSKPKYIGNISVSEIVIEPSITVKLISAEMTGNRNNNWSATFLIGDEPTRTLVRYRESFVINGNEFQLINLQTDRRTRKVVAYIRRTSVRRNIECPLNEPVSVPAPLTKARLFNNKFKSSCLVSAGTTFQLGTPETGLEQYKVIAINATTKQVIVEFESGSHEQITLEPVSPGEKKEESNAADADAEFEMPLSPE